MAVRVLILVSLLCVGVVVHARKAEPMNTFKLDLNVPPEERWKHIIEIYHSSVPLIVDYFNSLVCVYIMYVCVYVDVWLYTCVCIYNIYTYIYIYICNFIYLFVYIYI